MDYLNETNQTYTLLSDLKPAIIAATVQTLPGNAEYLTGESLVSRFVNRGRIEAYPFHVEMIANVMGRLLFIKQSMGTMRKSDNMYMDLLAPGQTFTPEFRGAHRPRPGLLDAAENQHRGRKDRVPESMKLGQDSDHLSSSNWPRSCLVFKGANGKTIQVQTNLKADEFPFKRNESNPPLDAPISEWESIEADDDTLTVTVLLETEEKKHTCTKEKYCGDLIRYVKQTLGEEKLQSIDEFNLAQVLSEDMPVPYIYIDYTNNGGHTFEIKTVDTYYDLDLPKARMGNASSYIGNLMF